MSDDPFYELVAAELERGYLAKGLWAKAIAKADGDEPRAKATYIRMRVSQLVQEAKASEIREQQERQRRADLETAEQVVQMARECARKKAAANQGIRRRPEETSDDALQRAVAKAEANEYSERMDKYAEKQRPVPNWAVWKVCAVFGGALILVLTILKFVLFQR